MAKNFFLRFVPLKNLLICSYEKDPYKKRDDNFLALLEWLYCNEVLNLKDEVAIELLKVSDKYSLPQLKVEAGKYLVKNITVENALERAKLASEENVKELEAAVVKFVSNKIAEGNKKVDVSQFPKPIADKILQNAK